MADLALALVARVAGEGGPVDGVGVTGQQHGMVLLDEAWRPCSPFIGWQDQRCQEPLPSGETCIERMLALGGDAFGRSGCRPATGYLGSTLFWLAQNGQLPKRVRSCFAADYLVSGLCDRPPVTDPTDAASSGLLDVGAGQWNEALVEALGLAVDLLPEVRPSCQPAGGVSAAAAKRTGLPPGVPVSVGCGDNQASFAGSVADQGETVLVNIGTGGQISAFVTQAVFAEELDLRPFLQGGFLLVGAGLCGGKSYRILRDFFRQVGKRVFGLSEMPDLYERLNALAADAPPGADGLRCEPIFAGTRREPERRAVWSGMSQANFTPGHMARALLEGIAEQFRLLREKMDGLGPRSQLVGSGNGLRKNPLLRQIMSDTFGLPMRIPQHEEEAAVGAALCASVAAGEFGSIQEAGAAFIRYSDA